MSEGEEQQLNNQSEDAKQENVDGTAQEQEGQETTENDETGNGEGGPESTSAENDEGGTSTDPSSASPDEADNEQEGNTTTTGPRKKKRSMTQVGKSTDLNRGEFAGTIVTVEEVEKFSSSHKGGEGGGKTEPYPEDNDKDDESGGGDKKEEVEKIEVVDLTAEEKPEREDEQKEEKTVSVDNNAISTFHIEDLSLFVNDAVEFKWKSTPNRIVRTNNRFQLPTKDAAGENNDDGKKKNADDDEDVDATELRPDGSFIYHFKKPGVYFFRSAAVSTMRLRVVVQRNTQDQLRERLIVYVGAVGALVAVLAILIVMLVLWAKEQTFLLPEDDDASSSSATSSTTSANATTTSAYRGRKEIRDAFLVSSFPWFVVGALGVVITMAVRLIFCCNFAKLSSFGRGFALSQQRKVQLTLFLSVGVVIVVVLYFWFLVLRVNYGFANLFQRISEGLVATINEAQSIMVSLNIIIQELPKVFPLYEVPESSQVLLKQMEALVADVRSWSVHGEEILRAAFRFVAIVSFLSLQVILYTVCGIVIAAFRRRHNLVRSSIWLLCASLVLVSFTIGTVSLLENVFERTYETMVAFRDKTLTTSGLQVASGQEKDSPLVTVLAACMPDGYLSLDFLDSMMTKTISTFNAELGQAGGGGSKLPVLKMLPADSGELTVSLLANYSDYLTAQLVAIDNILANDPTAIQSLIPSTVEVTLPLLRNTVQMTKSILGIVDCTLVRKILVTALPVLKSQVVDLLHIEYAISITTFAFLVLLIPLCMAAKYVFARPYKLWYVPETDRWFMFRCSYKAHKRLLADGKVKPGKMATWHELKCSGYDLLHGVHITNMVNSALLLCETILLILLNTSYEENRLNTLIQIVAMCCLLAPVCNFISAYCGHDNIVVRALFRAIDLGFSTLAVFLCVTYVIDTAGSTSKCVDEINQQRLAQNEVVSANVTSARAYPFPTGECGLDSTVRGIESAVYTGTIGFVCFLCAITSLVLLLCVKISTSVGTNLMKDKTQASERAKRSTMRIAGALTFISVLLVGGTVVIALTIFADVAPSNKIEKASHFSLNDRDPTLCNWMLPSRADGVEVSACNLPINKFMWFTTHNSMSSMESGFTTPNHFKDMNEQLHDGVRAFMLDVHPHKTKANEPYLCHGMCSLGGYPLRTEFDRLKEFLETNATQVVIVIFEQYVPASDIALVASQTGIGEFLWNETASPTANSDFEWPTLQALVSTNQRLLIFSDEKATSATPDFLHHMWDYMYETPYAIAQAHNFDCSINRGQSASVAVMASKMSILNHFVTNPLASPASSASANDPANLQQHIQSCAKNWTDIFQDDKIVPNFITVDFWTIGNPLRLVDTLNQGL